MVRLSTFLRLTARLAVMVPFAALLLYGASPALAQSFLGSAESFSVLAGGAVTCTNSVVAGDVGAGTTVTQTSCVVSGTVHEADLAATQAYTDFLSAYDALALTPCGPTLLTPVSQTLPPGVYCVPAAVTFTNVTLTLAGPANGTWLFKIGTGGTGALTGTGLSVVMAGGGQACNVNWWIAQAATLTTSTFQGTILAGADITVTDGTLNGDALAGGGGMTLSPTGAVTLTRSTIAGCTATSGGAPPIICDPDDEDDKDRKHRKDRKHHRDRRNHSDHDD